MNGVYEVLLRNLRKKNNEKSRIQELANGVPQRQSGAEDKIFPNINDTDRGE